MVGFLINTPILMGDGTYKNIQDVVKDDLVMSYDEETKEFKAQTVVNTITNTCSEITTYEFSDGTVVTGCADLQFLKSTSEYGVLEIGDEVIKNGATESVTLTAKTTLEETEATVYDLDIEDIDNFTVNGIVVHNATTYSLVFNISSLKNCTTVALYYYAKIAHKTTYTSSTSYTADAGVYYRLTDAISAGSAPSGTVAISYSTLTCPTITILAAESDCSTAIGTAIDAGTFAQSSSWVRTYIFAGYITSSYTSYFLAAPVYNDMVALTSTSTFTYNQSMSSLSEQAFMSPAAFFTANIARNITLTFGGALCSTAAIRKASTGSGIYPHVIYNTSTYAVSSVISSSSQNDVILPYMPLAYGARTESSGTLSTTARIFPIVRAGGSSVNGIIVFERSSSSRSSYIYSYKVSAVSDSSSKIKINSAYPYIVNAAGISSVSDSATITFATATYYAVTATAGTGVSSVFLSNHSYDLSGDASGSYYMAASNEKVYAYAKLAYGYSAPSSWTYISGTADCENSIYLVATKSGITAAYDFGTISATAKTAVTIALRASSSGKTTTSTGSWSPTSASAYTGDVISRSNNVVTCKRGGSGTTQWTSTYTAATDTWDILYNSTITYTNSSQTVSGASTITAAQSSSYRPYTVQLTGDAYGYWTEQSSGDPISSLTMYPGYQLALLADTTTALIFDVIDGSGNTEHRAVFYQQSNYHIYARTSSPEAFLKDGAFKLITSAAAANYFDSNYTLTVAATTVHDTHTVSITAGTGVSSAYVSTSSGQTSGSSSVTVNTGTTVYGYIVLSTGYSAPSGWTLLSGSTYYKASTDTFGTINASLTGYTVTASVSGTSYMSSWAFTDSTTSSGSMSSPANGATSTAYYGDSYVASATAKTTDYSSWTPASLTAPTVTDYGSDYVTIKNNSSYAAVVYYRISQDSGYISSEVTIPAGSEAEVTGLNVGTTYYFRLYASVTQSRTQHTYSARAVPSAGTITGATTITFTGGVTDTTQTQDNITIYSSEVSQTTRAKVTVTWSYQSSYGTWTTATESYNYGATPSRSSPGTVTSGSTRQCFSKWDDTSAVTEARTITAIYYTQYYITVNANTGCSATINGSGWYDSGATKSTTWTVDSSINYTFNSDEASESATTSTDGDGNTSWTANSAKTIKSPTVYARKYAISFDYDSTIKSAYTSSVDATQTSGNSSGTKYAGGTTVYLFATLADDTETIAYYPQSTWTQVGGSTSRTYYTGTSYKVVAAHSFSTISVTPSYVIALAKENGYGTWKNSAGTVVSSNIKIPKDTSFSIDSSNKTVSFGNDTYTYTPPDNTDAYTYTYQSITCDNLTSGGKVTSSATVTATTERADKYYDVTFVIGKDSDGNALGTWKDANGNVTTATINVPYMTRFSYATEQAASSTLTSNCYAKIGDTYRYWCPATKDGYMETGTVSFSSTTVDDYTYIGTGGAVTGNTTYVTTAVITINNTDTSHVSLIAVTYTNSSGTVVSESFTGTTASYNAKIGKNFSVTPTCSSGYKSPQNAVYIVSKTGNTVNVEAYLYAELDISSTTGVEYSLTYTRYTSSQATTSTGIVYGVTRYASPSSGYSWTITGIKDYDGFAYTKLYTLDGIAASDKSGSGTATTAGGTTSVTITAPNYIEYPVIYRATLSGEEYETTGTAHYNATVYSSTYYGSTLVNPGSKYDNNTRWSGGTSKSHTIDGTETSDSPAVVITTYTTVQYKITAPTYCTLYSDSGYSTAIATAGNSCWVDSGSTVYIKIVTQPTDTNQLRSFSSTSSSVTTSSFTVSSSSPTYPTIYNWQYCTSFSGTNCTARTGSTTSATAYSANTWYLSGSTIYWVASSGYAFDANGTTYKTNSVTLGTTAYTPPASITHAYLTLSPTNCYRNSGSTAGWYTLNASVSTTFYANTGYSYSAGTSQDIDDVQSATMSGPKTLTSSPAYVYGTVSYTRCSNSSYPNGSSYRAPGTFTVTADTNYRFSASSDTTSLTWALNCNLSASANFVNCTINQGAYNSAVTPTSAYIEYGTTITWTASDNYSYGGGTAKDTGTSTVAIGTFTYNKNPGYAYVKISAGSYVSSITIAGTAITSGSSSWRAIGTTITWTADSTHSFNGSSVSDTTTQDVALGTLSYSKSPNYVKCTCSGSGCSATSGIYASGATITWKADSNHSFGGSSVSDTSTDTVSLAQTSYTKSTGYTKCTISGNCCTFSPASDSILAVGSEITWTANDNYSFGGSTNKDTTKTAVTVANTSYSKAPSYVYATIATNTASYIDSVKLNGTDISTGTAFRAVGAIVTWYSKSNYYFSAAGATSDSRTIALGTLSYSNTAINYVKCTISASYCTVDRTDGTIYAVGTAIKWTANDNYSFGGSTSGDSTTQNVALGTTSYSKAPSYIYATISATYSTIKIGSTSITSGSTAWRTVGTTVTWTADENHSFGGSSVSDTTTQAIALGTTSYSKTPNYVYCTCTGTGCSATSGLYAKNATITWTADSNHSFGGSSTGDTATSTAALDTYSYSKTTGYTKCTISSSYCTCDKTNGAIYQNGTVITWTANDNYSFGGSTNKDTTTATVAVGTLSYSATPTYVYCTISGTNCSADNSTGFLAHGTTITWTGTSGTNYKYSFSNTSSTAKDSTTVARGTLTYSKTASYLWYNVTISCASNCTANYSSGYLLNGTTVTFTATTNTDTTRYAFSTSDSTKHTNTGTVSSAGQTISSGTVYLWYYCTCSGTQCTATSGWYRSGTNITWTAETGTNYKYSFTNSSVIYASSGATTTSSVSAAGSYTKTASYIYYNVTITPATNCTSNYSSNYLLSGTGIYFTATTSTSSIRYSFSNTDSTVTRDPVSTAYTVSSAGQSISSNTVYTWYNVTIGAKYNGSVFDSVYSWYVTGATVNSSSYYNSDPWKATAQYTYSGKTTDSITVGANYTSVYTTYSTRTVNKYTVTLYAFSDALGSLITQQSISVDYGTSVKSIDYYGSTYGTLASNGYCHSGGTGESATITSNRELTTTYTTAQYRVTYSLNSGSCSNTYKDVTYGSAYTLDTPTKSDCTFIGWWSSNNSDATQTATSGTTAITAPVTLYARWIRGTAYIYGTKSNGVREYYKYGNSHR